MVTRLGLGDACCKLTPTPAARPREPARLPSTADPRQLPDCALAGPGPHAEGPADALRPHSPAAAASVAGTPNSRACLCRNPAESWHCSCSDNDLEHLCCSPTTKKSWLTAAVEGAGLSTWAGRGHRSRGDLVLLLGHPRCPSHAGHSCWIKDMSRFPALLGQTPATASLFPCCSQVLHLFVLFFRKPKS